MEIVKKPTTGGNFDLKCEERELIVTRHDVSFTEVSLADLEGMRVSRSTVPASKHGLETITGASCETGAQ